MKTRAPLVLALTAFAPWGVTPEAAAQVTQIEIEVVESPALDGETFGEVGQYEFLRGRVYGDVDPTDRRHSGIVNLAHAPRNERGRVEYSTVIELYRPIRMERWNRAIYHTVPNRGGAGAADRALLERGFALARVGWQGDIPLTDRNIVPLLPVAGNGDGSPVVGPAMAEFIFNDDEAVSTGRLAYEAASLFTERTTLTVRRRQDAPRETPDDMKLTFMDSRTVQIERPAGFDGGAIYELVYVAKDPIVMGLGFVAMRDAISFLRYEEEDSEGNANPLSFRGLPEHAISLGISQSGRYLRDMLYLGFNEDTSGRIVFDGMHPDIAGSRKTFTNYVFSQPGRVQQQHENHLYPGDQFPFTYTTLTDPVSGRTDGLLERCSATDTCPKIVHTDSETEIWQARASLVVTDPLGNDIELPDNVRAYLVTGAQHGSGRGVHARLRESAACQYPMNPLAWAPIRTALSVALHEWVADGTEPPPTRYPSVGNGQLVPVAEMGFPAIPGVTPSSRPNPLRERNHRFVPPIDGDAYTVLVGKTDADGNTIGGVRHPNMVVPVGTHAGWNLRREGRAEGAQCGLTGSFIPFAMDGAERGRTGDPRLSLEERYPDHAQYVGAVSRAADRLVRQRYLLQPDADELVRRAQESPIGR